MIDATLITIHGFWSSPATWERLTDVWRVDEELRGLRIHAFDYPSPKKPRLPFSVTRVPNYDDIAQTLATEYATVLADASDIAVVTHSQGGLILQRFLTWMVSEGRARELGRIRSVVMLACPNGGSEYLESVRRTLGYGRHPQARSLQVLDRQVADTQRTVLQRIVHATAVDDYQCRIPFHVYAGGSDDIVKAASAQAAFPGASTIAGNHFTILDPAAKGNRTAETVKRHMLADITAQRAHPGAVPAPGITGEPERPAGFPETNVLIPARSGSTITIDPGSELVNVPAPSPHVIGNLPMQPPALIARSAVERIREVFRTGQESFAICAVTGMRGIGKTQIAGQYARLAVDEHCPLVAWVTGDDLDRLREDLAEVAIALGVAEPEGDSEKSAIRLRQALQSRSEPSVLVVDNAEAPDDVRPYLPTAGLVRVVVTSTDRAFGRFGREVDVSVLERPQSVAYLTARTGRDDTDGAGNVAAELGDLPLALAQAATVIELQGLSYSAYVERLQKLPLSDMLPPTRGDPYPQGTAKAILLALAAVEEIIPSRFGHILSVVAALAEEGVSGTALREIILGQDYSMATVAELDTVLGRLAEASIIGLARGGDVVVMHRLIARTIRDRWAFNGNFSGELWATAHALNQLWPADANEWRERARGFELVGHAFQMWRIAANAIENGAAPSALEDMSNLANRAIEFLLDMQDFARVVRVGTEILDECEETLGPSNEGTLVARINLVEGLRNSGDMEQAIYLGEATLHGCESECGGDGHLTCVARYCLGRVYQDAGRSEEAISLMTRNVESRSRIFEDESKEVLTDLNNLGGAYQAGERYHDAIGVYTTILNIARRSRGPDDALTLLYSNNLGSAYRQSGDPSRAIPLLGEALRGRRKILGDDHPWTLHTQNSLGLAYRDAGDFNRAVSLIQLTLEKRKHLLGPEHPKTLESRDDLAQIFAMEGKLETAIEQFEDILATCRRTLIQGHPLTVTVEKNLESAVERRQK